MHLHFNAFKCNFRSVVFAFEHFKLNIFAFKYIRKVFGISNTFQILFKYFSNTFQMCH